MGIVRLATRMMRFEEAWIGGVIARDGECFCFGNERCIWANEEYVGQRTTG